MKNLIIKEMKLVSFVEKKAKRITFHPNITVIKGDNHTGKSSLIKSIYWTFGAEPKDMHQNWKTANAITLIDFMIDEESYSILRKENFFAVFDSKQKVIKTFNGITKGIGPFLAELFDYRIKLNDRSGELLIPPPAYFFLPFYIDQDAGWNDNWNSFTKLSQFSNWREKIVNYHTGIKPNEYYELKALIETYYKEISDLEYKRVISDNIRSKINDQIKEEIVLIDSEEFKKEVEDLLTRYEELNARREKLKQRILELENDRLDIENQVKVVQGAIDELKADFEFSTELSNIIECPTCGVTYENSFAERFSIAKDEDTCRNLLYDLDLELIKTRIKIKEEYLLFNTNNQEIKNIEVMLSKKKGSTNFKDMILNEGKKEMNSIIENEITELTTTISLKEQFIESLKSDLRMYEDRKRQKRIRDRYFELMQKNLLNLGVLTMDEKSYKKISSRISESGSGKPRALLAYYYSILQVMKENATSTFCPIIIDSPNQQDQEKQNLERMLQFIIMNKPNNAQLILGLVEIEGIAFEGKTITLDNKFSLLREEEYEAVSEEISVLLDKCEDKS
ncbi:hypothetical protein [Bacillus sp. 1A]|uniref:hypothetical protein n=1 Tax=Bacillus sp. 1A TaxID=3461399 RepID=UPI004044C8B1